MIEHRIEIKVYPDMDDEFSFRAAAGKINVDWGDGVVDEFTPNEKKREFVHRYADRNVQIVAIRTENITGIEFGAHKDPSKGRLRELRIGDCPKLKTIVVDSDEFGELTLLEIGKAESLTTLHCTGNKLSSLNVGGCTALKTLNCDDNSLMSLNVGGCASLRELYCNANALTRLNVNGCTALQELYCSDNRLTSLNVDDCTVLRELYCSNNRLTSLNIGGHTDLRALHCFRNQLTSSAIDDLFGRLPRQSYPHYGEISVTDNPGSRNCDEAIAETKGWRVRRYY